MKLKLYEEAIFIFLVILFSYSFFSLFNYSSMYYIYGNKNLIEAMEEDDEDDEDKVDPDLDIHETDYVKQLKSVKNYGFSKDGNWSTLKHNVGRFKGMLDGIVFKQTLLTKKRNPIGIKFAVKTGFDCNDPDGGVHKQYTYIDNEGDPNLGLAFEIGNSIGKYGDSMKGFSDSMSSSEETKCKELELDVLDNAGKRRTQTVHIDTKEMENIKPNNILNIKTYDTPDEVPDEEEQEEQEEEVEEEGFINLNEILSKSSINVLLLNDELFYKDSGIFMYFLLLNSLFLYFIFILIINN